MIGRRWHISPAPQRQDGRYAGGIEDAVTAGGRRVTKAAVTVALSGVSASLLSNLARRAAAARAKRSLP